MYVCICVRDPTILRAIWLWLLFWCFEVAHSARVFASFFFFSPLSLLPILLTVLYISSTAHLPNLTESEFQFYGKKFCFVFLRAFFWINRKSASHTLKMLMHWFILSACRSICRFLVATIRLWSAFKSIFMINKTENARIILIVLILSFPHTIQLIGDVQSRTVKADADASTILKLVFAFLLPSLVCYASNTQTYLFFMQVIKTKYRTHKGTFLFVLVSFFLPIFYSLLLLQHIYMQGYLSSAKFSSIKKYIGRIKWVWMLHVVPKYIIIYFIIMMTIETWSSS